MTDNQDCTYAQSFVIIIQSLSVFLFKEDCRSVTAAIQVPSLGEHKKLDASEETLDELLILFQQFRFIFICGVGCTKSSCMATIRERSPVIVGFVERTPIPLSSPIFKALQLFSVLFFNASGPTKSGLSLRLWYIAHR